MPIRRSLAHAAGLLAITAPTAAANGRPGHHHKPPRPAPEKTVDLQLLALNDLHGHLESTTPGQIQVTEDPTSRVQAGGAEYLATNRPCAGAADPVSDLEIGGTLVSDVGTYRITANSFLADGGDRFFVPRDGTARTGGPLDLDALEAYLEPSVTGSPLAVPALDRIDRAP